MGSHQPTHGQNVDNDSASHTGLSRTDKPWWDNSTASWEACQNVTLGTCLQTSPKLFPTNVKTDSCDNFTCDCLSDIDDFQVPENA